MDKNHSTNNGAKSDIEGEKKQAKLTNKPLSFSLKENIQTIKALFENDDTLKIREFSSADNQRKYCVIYSTGLVDINGINEFVIRPLIQSKDIDKNLNAIDYMMNNILQVCELKKIETFEEMLTAITYGDTLLLTEGYQQGILLETKSFNTRSLSEPEEEKILSGPREGFNECIITNISLVRRKLRTNNLKLQFMSIGKRTHTQICVAYIEGVANKKALKELLHRLKKIDIDGIVESNYINELIRDDGWSPFRTVGETERPDVVVGKMLEGRIALFTDGTPVVLTLPFLFIENFQSPEDYYIDIYEAGFSRLIRILGFLIAISVPAIYISIVAFHHEVLPSALMISIAVERESVPLPASLECFLMLTMFYILRETGLRMPTNVGQAMSIVGALVIGQAAVQAKLVAAPMIIIVAVTGITSLLVPKMTAPTLISCFGLLFLASTLGFLGFMLGLTVLIVHILCLHSFGILQLLRDEKATPQRFKDIFVRMPWQQMLTRPHILSKNKIRQKRVE